MRARCAGCHERLPGCCVWCRSARLQAGGWLVAGWLHQLSSRAADSAPLHPMPLCRKHIKRQQRLLEADVWCYLLQACRGLEHLHM